jgi:hypothetical protein
VTRRLALILLCTLVAGAAGADMHGAWTATTDRPGEVHLFMTTGAWQNFGRTLTDAELGIDRSVLTSTQTVPVTIKLDRDAGTIVMEGTFKNGDGAGQFTFAPRRDFLNSVRSMGIEVDLRENRSEEDELFTLAVNDVSRAYVRSMHDLFSDATLHQIRRARGVDVTPAYIAGIRKAGVEVSDLHEVVRLKAVNVTPEFINELASSGYTHLSARDLIRLAAVGVDGKFIRDMSKYRDKQ